MLDLDDLNIATTPLPIWRQDAQSDCGDHLEYGTDYGHRGTVRGDEFMASPETDESLAIDIAERPRNNVAKKGGPYPRRSR
jgi:hypothetical protein